MEPLLQNILKDINKEHLSSKIDQEVYTYIDNLKTFLSRLFKICYDKSLEEFSIQHLELLLYLVKIKREDLKKCYPILKENHIYLKLKKIPLREDYERILNLLSDLGKEVEAKYKFSKKYSEFLNSLKLSKKIIPLKEEKPKILKATKGKSKSVDKILTLILLAILILEVALIVYLIFNNL